MGKAHVGIGTDFEDPGGSSPHSLDDVSKHPALTAALVRRDWSDAKLVGTRGTTCERAAAAADERGELSSEARLNRDGPKWRKRGYAPCHEAGPTVYSAVLYCTVRGSYCY